MRDVVERQHRLDRGPERHGLGARVVRAASEVQDPVRHAGRYAVRKDVLEPRDERRHGTVG
jgi:hypothetical protein